ncbi:hypothetical protein [Nonomuraea endophytica]|uniref:Uncharacterized protein n=1 Tax=Nonomuraea endophytica TaxID=714136 RepID=A0A7W8A9X7_9ACTN|nr:hypothetical protein [Nonomuraea endophytica]MBB5081335.1 hypothetical protein [Nonomuraea endophytica]
MRHGEYATYTVQKCRCTECKAASAAYARERHRLLAYGRWKPFADTEAVRAHVLNLRRYISYDAIALLAQVPARSIDLLVYGEAGSPGSARMRTETATRLLAVSIDLDQMPDEMRISVAGSRRRLQALMLRGWAMPLVSERCEVPRWQLDKVLNVALILRVFQARAIRDVTAQLFDQDPPLTTRSERHTAAIVRNRARRNGWVPLAAWDDIDDPDVEPDLGTTVPRAQAITEDAAFLAEQGLTPNQVAERLQISRGYLQKARARAAATSA